MGILEIPVTRMIPSGRSWFPYTLTPITPLFRLCKLPWEHPLLITPIFHSWGVRNRDFVQFLRMLSKMLDYFQVKSLEPVTLSEAHDLLVS
jgi:hypothetical protein